MEKSIKKYLNSVNILIFIFLLLGVAFRLLLTANGSFIFNMDNARDFIDVREMITLYNPRLIGPSSGIEGLHNGPGWYFLLAIPFTIFKGHPFGGIALMISLWLLGGIFLLKIASRWGIFSLISVGSLWVASSFIVLTALYSFNPSPVVLLMPVFIFIMEKFLNTSKSLFSIIAAILAASFFHFEMAFGIFMPIIILLSILITGKKYLLKTRSFWLGLLVYLMILSPQIIFDIKHDFTMTQSVYKYITQSSKEHVGLVKRFGVINKEYTNVLNAAFMNQKVLLQAWLILAILLVVLSLKKGSILKEKYIAITILVVLVPYSMYILTPISVMPWHIGGSISAVILLTGLMIHKVQQVKVFGIFLAFIITVSITAFSFNNLELNKNLGYRPPSNDPSSFQNELAAVDYVFKKANGKDFKVYAYLPSIIDYPYQYLFWWRGINKYGYVPSDYAYLHGQPPYIKNKEKLPVPKQPESSDLIFLIKEPDRDGRRHLWENSFTHTALISSEKVGPLMVEIRK